MKEIETRETFISFITLVDGHVSHPGENVNFFFHTFFWTSTFCTKYNCIETVMVKVSKQSSTMSVVQCVSLAIY